MTEHQWAILDDIGIIKQESEEEMRTVRADITPRHEAFIFRHPLSSLFAFF